MYGSQLLVAWANDLLSKHITMASCWLPLQFWLVPEGSALMLGSDMCMQEWL